MTHVVALGVLAAPVAVVAAVDLAAAAVAVDATIAAVAADATIAAVAAATIPARN
jgi:hypothetical protein|tara:strand:- start:32533 stop:32697 length:165 start_codon:yes stop_codon:yes gene_type:complete